MINIMPNIGDSILVDFVNKSRVEGSIIKWPFKENGQCWVSIKTSSNSVKTYNMANIVSFSIEKDIDILELKNYKELIIDTVIDEHISYHVINWKCSRWGQNWSILYNGLIYAVNSAYIVSYYEIKDEK